MNVRRFWTRRVQHGRHGCSKVPARERNDINRSEGSKSIFFGIRSATWRGWNAKIWSSYIVQMKRESWDKDGGILSDEPEVIERGKQHYEEHLNGAGAENQGRGEAGKDGIGAELISMGPNQFVCTS